MGSNRRPSGIYPDPVNYVSLALQEDGSSTTPYIVCRDTKNDDKATVSYYSSGWKKLNPAVISDNTVTYTSLAFSGATPYVIYRDDVSGKAIVKRHNGLTGTAAAWEPVPAAPLPVTLMNYTAELQNTGVAKLQWQTASESNNKEFIVSRSSDGKTFREIGRVPGSGNSALKKEYVFSDRNPVSGVNYYRLQQQDLDGKIEDLGVKTVTLSLDKDVVKIYPNPTADELKVEFSAGLYNQLEVVDLNGRVLQRMPLNTLLTQATISLHHQAAGIYFVRLIGKDVVVKRVVKE